MLGISPSGKNHLTQAPRILTARLSPPNLPFQNQIPWDKPGKKNRLQQAIQQSEILQGLEYNRLGLAIDAKWANELLIRYDNDKQEVHFLLYPGNTKQQGHHLYKNGEVKLPANHILVINDLTFSMETKVHLKFSHFNKYVAGLTFDTGEALIKPVTTKQNFNKYAGKWKIERWPQLYKFLDEHFKSDYNWQAKSHWQSCFQKSNRSYFTFSLGYEVKLIVRYETLQKVDNDNLTALSSFIEQVQDQMIEFVESRDRSLITIKAFYIKLIANIKETNTTIEV